MTKIAILGSGTVGDTLKKGFEKHGYEVKQAKRPQFAEAAAWGDIVVLAVKGAHAQSALEMAGAGIAGKTVIDATNPIDETKPPVNGVLAYFTSINESLIERLQAKFPTAKLVKAFSSVGAPFMVNPAFASKPSMFICGNDAGAKAQVGEILDKFGWETADMGAVEAGRAIEPLCILWCIRGLGQGKWDHAFKMLTVG